MVSSMELAIRSLVNDVEARFKNTKEGSAYQNFTNASAYMESVELEDALARFTEHELPHVAKKPK